VFSDEHIQAIQRRQPTTQLLSGPNAVSEVPGKEMDAVGSDGGCMGRIQLPRNKLNWHCMNGTLDAHTYIVADEAVAGCARVVFKTKRKRGNSNRTKHLAIQQSPLSVGWSSMGLIVVEGWPTKGDDINPIENLWAILDERLESKKFKTENGMKKAIRQVWDEVDLSLLHNLINSIPDRLRRIRKAQGGPIKAVK